MYKKLRVHKLKAQQFTYIHLNNNICYHCDATVCFPPLIVTEEEDELCCNYIFICDQNTVYCNTVIG